MKTARTKSKVYVFKENTQQTPSVKTIRHLEEYGEPFCFACGHTRFTDAFIHEINTYADDRLDCRLTYFCDSISCGHSFVIRRFIPADSGFEVGDQIPVKNK